MSIRAISLVFSLWLGIAAVEAAPIAVLLPEGNTRGFLVLRSSDGEAIAQGELQQKPAQGWIESRLSLAFKDGSQREELAVFSQDKVFRLESYRLVERGPSFPTAEIAFDRRSGQYRARTQDKKGDEEHVAAGQMEMPPDLYNGMALVLLKNLGDGEKATGQMAVFTPKPRLLRMELHPGGEEKIRVGGSALTVRRYLMKLEIGGLTGTFASFIGKDPPESRYWLATGEVPAFVRFEGALLLKGPRWRIEMITPEWPR